MAGKLLGWEAEFFERLLNSDNRDAFERFQREQIVVAAHNGIGATANGCGKIFKSFRIAQIVRARYFSRNDSPAEALKAHQNMRNCDALFRQSRGKFRSRERLRRIQR